LVTQARPAEAGPPGQPGTRLGQRPADPHCDHVRGGPDRTQPAG